MSDDIVSRLAANSLSPRFLSKAGIASFVLLLVGFHLSFHTDQLPDLSGLPVVLLGSLIFLSVATLSSILPYLFWLILGAAGDRMVENIILLNRTESGTLSWFFSRLVRTFSDGYFFEEASAEFLIDKDSIVTKSMKVSHILSDYHGYSSPYIGISFLMSCICIVLMLNALVSLPFINELEMLLSFLFSIVLALAVFIIYCFIIALSYLDYLRIGYQLLLGINKKYDKGDMVKILTILKQQSPPESGAS